MGSKDPSYVDLCPADDIPEGAREVFEIAGRWVAVFCVSGRFYAIDDVCTHDGNTLTEDAQGRPVPLDGYEIECPRHGARFDIRDGRALTAPAYRDVRRYEVRVVDGMLQIMI
jgi:3-phenylpropionate/trans-cinnamate dioxygenase ferredoxin subunit